MIKNNIKNKDKNTGNQLGTSDFTTKYNWVSPHLLTGATEKRTIAKIGYGDREQYKFVVSNYSIYNTFSYEFNNHIIFRSTYDNQSKTWADRPNPNPNPNSTLQTGGNEIMSNTIAVPRGMSFMLQTLFNDNLPNKNINKFIDIRNDEYIKLENNLLDLTNEDAKRKESKQTVWKALFISNLLNNNNNLNYTTKFTEKNFLDF